MRELNPDARLLIVDDCISTVSMLRNILNRLGFSQIDTVSDSRETRARIAEFNPDLIILDLIMPHLDGFEVMRQLRSAGSSDTFLPVLVLTSDTTEATRRKALLTGATDLVTKPFNPSEILMRIRNLLQIRFLQLALHAQNQTLEIKVEERTRELREMQQQVVARERLRAFGEMASGIVHDFNNALMSVIGYSELLLNNDAILRDVEKARKFLQIVHAEGQDASRIIGRLRDFYRPREQADVFAEVNMNEVIEQAVSLTRPKWDDQALATGTKISVEMDLAKLPPVSGNAGELREVTANLIFNAIDALPSGGRITIRSSAEQGQALIEVADNGIGMDDEVRLRCLEPFFTTKEKKGAGLGLSTAFGIINRHQGGIEIESTPGTGTTIRVRLPLPTQASDQEEPEAYIPPRSLRLLVVDDQARCLDVIESFLTADGHSVVTSADGDEAIDRFKRSNFDLVIADYAMPGMNGRQLAATLRELSPGHPVILLTGFPAASSGEEESRSPVDLIMRKPVRHRELRRALATVLKN